MSRGQHNGSKGSLSAKLFICGELCSGPRGTGRILNSFVLLPDTLLTYWNKISPQELVNVLVLLE